MSTNGKPNRLKHDLEFKKQGNLAWSTLLLCLITGCSHQPQQFSNAIAHKADGNRNEISEQQARKIAENEARKILGDKLETYQPTLETFRYWRVVVDDSSKSFTNLFPGHS